MFSCRADELLNPLKYIASIAGEAIFEINTPDHSNEWYISFINPDRTIAGYGLLKDSAFTYYDNSETEETGLDVAHLSDFLPLYGKDEVTIEFIDDKIKIDNRKTYGAKLEYTQSLISIASITTKPIEPMIKGWEERFSLIADLDLKANISAIKKAVSKYRKNASYIIFYNDPDNDTAGLKIIDFEGNVLTERVIPPMSGYYPQAICVLDPDAFYEFFYKVPATSKDLSVVLSLQSTGHWGSPEEYYSEPYYSEPCRLKIEFGPYFVTSVTSFLAPSIINGDVLSAAGVSHLLPEKPTEEEEEIEADEKKEELPPVQEVTPTPEEEPRVEEAPVEYEDALESCADAITEAIEYDTALPIDGAEYDFYILADALDRIGRDEQEEICSIIRSLLQDDRKDLLDGAMEVSNFADLYEKCDEAGLLEEAPVKAPPAEPPSLAELKEREEKVKPEPPKKIEKPPVPKPKPKLEKPPAEVKKEEIGKEERKEERRNTALEGWIKNQVEADHPEVDVDVSIIDDKVKIKGTVTPEYEDKFTEKEITVEGGVGEAHILKKDFGKKLDLNGLEYYLESAFPKVDVNVSIIRDMIDIVAKVKPEYEHEFIKNEFPVVSSISTPLFTIKEELGKILDGSLVEEIIEVQPKSERDIERVFGTYTEIVKRKTFKKGEKDIHLWVDERLRELEETGIEAEELSNYITDGLCIHFTEDAAEEVHRSIAEAFGADPEKMYDSKSPSVIEKYDYMVCFDLTRDRPDKPFMAAGGRFKPTDLINMIQSRLPSESYHIDVASEFIT